MTRQPHPDRVRLLPWPVSPWLVDGFLIVVLVLGWLVRRLVVDGSNASLDAVSVAVAVALIPARHRWPRSTLAAGVLAGTVVAIAADQPSIIMPATLVALYAVAADVDWRKALAAGAIVMLVFSGLVVFFLEPGRLEGGLLAALAWPAFATTAGIAVRAGRLNLAGAQERAERAEATREAEARRRVAEERLRIARDVHDLVAHHLAVVNVQSGVAAHVLRSDPDAATTALETVRSSASTAVTELGELLGVLREPDGSDGAGGDAGPVDPTPDLQALDDLIASFAASGLAVEHRITGAPILLAPSVQVAAYRVIQEALTNAHKHGDGSALIAQRFAERVMEIEITNRVGPENQAAGQRSGFGLIGMGERVDAAGGELTIDDTGGRFVLVASFPALVTS